jgi:hypothetical protein
LLGISTEIEDTTGGMVTNGEASSSDISRRILLRFARLYDADSISTSLAASAREIELMYLNAASSEVDYM